MVTKINNNLLQTTEINLSGADFLETFIVINNLLYTMELALKTGFKYFIVQLTKPEEDK